MFSSARLWVLNLYNLIIRSPHDVNWHGSAACPTYPFVFSTRPEYAPVGTDSRMDCYMIVTKNSDASVLWTGAGYTLNGGKKLVSNLRKKMEEG